MATINMADPHPSCHLQIISSPDPPPSSIDTTTTTRFNKNESKDKNRPQCFTSTLQECLFVCTATLSIGMFQFLYGTTTVVAASVAESLEMSSAEVIWINTSFALTAACFPLLFAQLADHFGRRRLLVFSIFAFSISALVAGLATSAIYLNVLGGVLGLWSAAAVAPAVGILGAAYEMPSRRKNIAFACFSAGNPVGFVLGSLLSGVAAKLFSWRASFFLLAVVYAGVAVGSFWTVPKDEFQRSGFSWAKMRTFDIIGMALSTAGLGLVCSSLTIAGNAPHGWKTPYILALLVLGVAILVAFIVWEGFYQHAFMPLRIWRNWNFSLINLIVVFGFMSFVVCDFWLTLYMQAVLKYNPLTVGIHLLPAAIGGIVMNIVAAFILDRVNNTVLTGIGTLSLTGSAILLATMGSENAYWTFIFPALILSVVGADLIFNVGNMFVMSSLPSAQQSLAGGIFNTVNKMCVTIGIGIAGGIYNSQSTNHEALQTEFRPYQMVFWFAAAAAGLSCLIVPFLRIGTQGHTEGSVIGSDDSELSL